MRGLIVGVFVLAAALTGAAVAKPELNACRIITNAQVSHALGTKVAYRKAIGTTGCSWTTVPLSSFGPSTASLDASLGPVSRSHLLKFEKTERGHGRLIANLGEWAYWDETFPGGSLFVAKDGYLVSVEAFGITAPLTADKEIALLVVRHL